MFVARCFVLQSGLISIWHNCWFRDSGMKKIFLITGLLFNLGLFAQEKIDIWHIAVLHIEHQDTTYMMNLPEVVITGRAAGRFRAKIRRYNRLVRHVKKVYPYAKLAAAKMKEYEKEVLAAGSEAEKKRRMKNAEIALKNQFQDDIKKLTFKQGVILIKLIDRETGSTSYDIIKELRGSFNAILWQTVAKIFGYSLRTKYEPYGRDKDIEDIVRKIEKGEL